MTATIINPMYQTNRLSNSREANPSQAKIGRTADVPVGGFDTFVKRQGNYREVPAEVGSYRVGEARRNKISMITHASRVPEAIRERILACQREEDWDEEGGMGITEASCKASVRFLEDALDRKESIPMPRISASAFGAVTFQWRNGNEHLLIRIFSDTVPVFYHSEVIGEFRDIGEEPRSKAVERVLRLFESYAA